MKNVFLFGATLAVLFTFSQGAMALSTETRDNTNSDGTAKFADPEDQTPRGLVSPGAGGSMHLSGPLNEPSVNQPSVQQMMGVNHGGNAFDNAYNHVTNQNQ